MAFQAIFRTFFQNLMKGQNMKMYVSYQFLQCFVRVAKLKNVLFEIEKCYEESIDLLMEID